jgi:hypothetical protein
VDSIMCLPFSPWSQARASPHPTLFPHPCLSLNARVRPFPRSPCAPTSSRRRTRRCGRAFGTSWRQGWPAGVPTSSTPPPRPMPSCASRCFAAPARFHRETAH